VALLLESWPLRRALSPRPAPWGPRASLPLSLLVCAALLGASLFGCEGAAAEGLEAELEGRGRVLVLGSPALAERCGAGTSPIFSAQLPEVERAFAGSDERALLAALRAAEIDGLLVESHLGSEPPRAPAEGGEGAELLEAPARPSLRERLERYESIPTLRGIYLGPEAAYYEPAERAIFEAPVGEAAARVARAVIAGRSPPRIAAFPEPLRRIRDVEVMVLLTEGGRRRLWRSARGSSIARALLTASVVARERWQERESAMGGALERRLPLLAVEVALLVDDGTLGSRERGFIDRVFTPEHGVAYERPGAWRYLLPEATQEAGEGSASRAYEALLRDNGIGAAGLRRADLRLYRLAVRTLGRSEPPSSAIAPDSSSGAAAPSRPEAASGRPSSPEL